MTARGQGETADAAAAWEASCLRRERWEGTTALLLIGALVPAWVPFDALLEPARLRPFTAMRLVATATAWAAIPLVRRARTVRSLRSWVAAEAAFSGTMIALMLPHVHHFAAYVFGFSLYFWGAGALFSWPAAWSVGLLGWLLAVMSAGFALWPGTRDLGDFVTAGFYLGSAGSMSTVMTLLRRRVVRGAFAASHELARRNEDVERALEQLRDAQARLVASEKLSALGRLLAGLSHEINNPMNVLQNNLEPLRASLDRLLEVARAAGEATPEDLEALRRRCAALDVDATSRDVRDAAELMRTAMDRVRQVHADLRAFVRGDAPGMVVDDVNVGLRATAALLSRRLPDEVRLALRLDALPPTTFQPGQLNQVWHNLIQNGLDAVGDAGTVTVRSRVVAGQIEVSVTDTGPGVAPELRPRLFEPFFTTKGVGKGTGLGLATSYQIVERHGGALLLDPDHAGGAKFVVQLPVRAAPPAADARGRRAG